MSRARAASRKTFAALANPNYRLYTSGQAVSLVGTWMQIAAQSWLVLTLTNSSTDLGVVVALQALPILFLGSYAGVIADRVDKRRLMVVLQSCMGIQALVLGVLTVAGSVRLWEICVLAFLLGMNSAFELPTRQAFMLELVGPEHLSNAVSLNSVLTNVARLVGPAVAGLVIASVGEGACFLINAATFAAVVTSLLRLDRSHLRRSPPTERGRGQLREGLRYVSRTPELAAPLLMMVLIGMLAYEFPVILPVVAKETFHGGPETYGFMTAAMGVGSVAGGLAMAGRGRTGLQTLVLAAAGFGVAVLFAAFAPTLVVEFAALAIVGWVSIWFFTRCSSTLQLAAEPSMRGRVMALWAVAYQGTTPIGGPVIGWVSAQANPRVAFAVGGIACLVASLLGLMALRASGRPISATTPAET